MSRLATVPGVTVLEPVFLLLMLWSGRPAGVQAARTVPDRELAHLLTADVEPGVPELAAPAVLQQVSRAPMDHREASLLSVVPRDGPADSTETGMILIWRIAAKERRV